MSWLTELDSANDRLAIGGAVKVFRRGMGEDPYSKKLTAPGPWRDAASWVLYGAAILATPGAEVRGDSDRIESVTQMMLHASDPRADLKKGDGVAASLDATAPDFVISTKPVSNRNPLTGWEPCLEVPLKGVIG